MDEDSTPLKQATDKPCITLSQAEYALLKRQQRDFFALLENTQDFIYIKDDQHRFTSASNAFARLTGHPHWQEIVGKTDFDIFPPELAEVYYRAERDVITQGKQLLNHEEPYYNESGKLCWVLSSKRAVYNAQGEVAGLVGISKDITALKEYKAHIEHLADHDGLTQLLNRRTFLARANEYFCPHEKRQRRFAVIFMDLDGFKEINDAFGHHRGDQALVSFAKALKSEARKSDLVARFSGDEFVALIHMEHAGAAAAYISRVLQKLAQTQTEPPLTSSVGIAYYPDHGHQMDALLKLADSAMYQAKRRKTLGESTVCEHSIKDRSCD